MTTPPLFPTVENLVTLPQAKAWLDIPSDNTTQDVLLNLQIPMVSVRITAAMNRTHWLLGNAANPLKEWYAGTNTDLLALRQWPVRSVTAVYEDESFFYGSEDQPAATTLLTPGTDYCLVADAPDGVSSLSGLLLRLDDVWQGNYEMDIGGLASYAAPGRGNIYVGYSVGYDSIPYEVQQAALMLMARLTRTNTFGWELSSLNYEEYADGVRADVNRAWGYLSGEIMAALARYRIKPFGSF